MNQRILLKGFLLNLLIFYMFFFVFLAVDRELFVDSEIESMECHQIFTTTFAG